MEWGPLYNPVCCCYLGLEIRVLSLWRESDGARTAAAGAEQEKCRTNALEADFLTFSFQRAGAQTSKLGAIRAVPSDKSSDKRTSFLDSFILESDICDEI